MGGVRFRIDGKDLAEIVQVYETKHFGEDPAAGMAYAPIDTVYWDGENYFTRPSKTADFLDEGGALVLICDCGEWGCWNMFCTIRFTEDSVVWADFRKHHRDWKYDLRFEFDKDLYLTEFGKCSPAPITLPSHLLAGFGASPAPRKRRSVRPSPKSYRRRP